MSFHIEDSAADSCLWRSAATLCLMGGCALFKLDAVCAIQCASANTLNSKEQEVIQWINMNHEDKYFSSFLSTHNKASNLASLEAHSNLQTFTNSVHIFLDITKLPVFSSVVL